MTRFTQGVQIKSSSLDSFNTLSQKLNTTGAFLLNNILYSKDLCGKILN